jgi:hypothetical protein
MLSRLSPEARASKMLRRARKMVDEWKMVDGWNGAQQRTIFGECKPAVALRVSTTIWACFTISP